MQLNPYLNFNGQSLSLQVLERVLGGKITFSIDLGEMPAPTSFAESHKLIMHATLSVGDRVLWALILGTAVTKGNGH